MSHVHPPLPQTDLVDAVRLVLKHSSEPLTAVKIRERLNGPFRGVSIDELIDVLTRQVAADVLVICPKYRSSQDRYWDRPLREHAKSLLRAALCDGPLTWTDLRKKLPKYLRHLADSVLNEEVAREAIFRHPPASSRMGPRYALQPADLRTYVSRELHELLARFEANGFARQETCEAILDLLREEEWSDLAPAAALPAPAELCKTPVY
jgi:hypothetical protein